MDSADRMNALSSQLLHALEADLGWLLTMEDSLTARIQTLADPAEAARFSTRSRALLKGSLLVYLFALWQSHAPKDFRQWMTASELQEFDAYEHVRDSVAHTAIGGRADWPRKRRAFESRYPFSAVEWDTETDTIDVADSTIVTDCLSWFMGMSAQLAARLSIGQRPSVA